VPLLWAEASEGERRACYAHPAGDEDLVRCPACGYAALRAWAETAWPDPPDEPELPTEEVVTPGCNTIASLAEFLGIPATQTLKMVFYSVEGKVTCAVIRGDRLVDEAKLARVLGTHWYYPSLEEELDAVGAVGGYASPIGLDPERVRVVADPSVRSGRNLVSGANRPDYHLRNVNVPRDFRPGEWVNLALIQAEDPCPRCRTALEVLPAFVLALGAAPAPCSPAAEYLDADGRGQPLWMARWWLDLGRLMAALVEAHHDERGIVWPVGCAPFDVHLVALDLREEAIATQAEALYRQLQAEGLAVLFDDRDASAGVKFNDADLIGLPLRLTLGKRAVQEGIVEAKWRNQEERLKLDPAGLAAELCKLRRP
jgi:prolyl-tRNA synthetase